MRLRRAGRPAAATGGQRRRETEVVADEANLPLYVEEPPPRARSRPSGGGQQALVLEKLRSAGRAAVATADRLVANGDPVPGAAALPDVEVHHQNGFTVTRHVLARPTTVVPAFDAWLTRTRAVVATAQGRLHPRDRPVVCQPHQLRLVAAVLRVHGSLIPVPVDLELVPWGSYRAALNINLARRFVKSMGRHRRAAYFESAHAVLEQIRQRIEASLDVAER
jgi:hypothetical protein